MFDDEVLLQTPLRILEYTFLDCEKKNEFEVILYVGLQKKGCDVRYGSFEILLWHNLSISIIKFIIILRISHCVLDKSIDRIILDTIDSTSDFITFGSPLALLNSSFAVDCVMYTP